MHKQPGYTEWSKRMKYLSRFTKFRHKQELPKKEAEILKLSKGCMLWF